MKKPELLAPAGSPEKLKFALHYGADAVYCAGKQYGLRSGAGNFSLEELKEAAEYTHSLGKKIYVTLNASLKNDDLEGLTDYIHYLKEIGIDHVICADPGVFLTVRQTEPDLKVSMSTQSNTLNIQSCNFWYQNGARRIVLARELGIKDIKEIIEQKPEDLEIEMFVHGAMCISHSGRCLLSNYMTGRDANKGECAQPCRWNYYLNDQSAYSVTESQRPDQAFDIVEDPKQGTFIFNSKDLCLIDHIPELIENGVSSFKIEGRMKSPYYVSSVVSAYRQKIDDYFDNNLKDPEYYRDELEKVSHRDYTTAFYDGPTTDKDQNYGTSSYIRSYDYAGIVLDYDEETGIATIEQRNKILNGDEIEILRAQEKDFITIDSVELFDQNDQPLESTPHAKMVYKIKSPKVAPMDIVRRKSNK